MVKEFNQGYKTIKDLAKILSLFNSQKNHELSIKEISKQLGMLPSKVSRMIRTMEGEGFFEKNEQTKKYRLGIEFLRLGLAYMHHSPLRKIVRPHLEQIASKVLLVVVCAVQKNGNIIIMDRVENYGIDKMSIRLVLDVPIHSTAIGKVLLAYNHKNEINQILKSITLNKYTSNTIVDPRKIKRHLNMVRKNGYAIDIGETQEDLNAIAAPIKDGDNKVVASIGLAGDPTKFSENRMRDLVPYLLEKTHFISRQLGFYY
jgi:DNA-binding IclR family transcriptional regulator